MKRITIITGHYGSGKSEIAINMAISHSLDMLVDLDVVNPYFRSRSAHKVLGENNIELVDSSLAASSGSDLPYISQKGRIPFVNKEKTAIYDLAGSMSGAKVMMQFIDFVGNEDYDMLLAVNVYRPETANKDAILKTVSMIEGASQMKVTGLINNANLMKETQESHLLHGQDVLREVSETLNVPIVMTCHAHTWTPRNTYEGELFPLTRYVKSG
jgi:hypothetical protein